jgi:hypothetical protein
MTDNTSQGPQAPQTQEATRMPVRLVRGEASPEELAALVTVLATSTGDGAPDPTDRHTPAGGRYTPPPWGAPRRMLRVTYPHRPGGWRSSAFPR